MFSTPRPLCLLSQYFMPRKVLDMPVTIRPKEISALEDDKGATAGVDPVLDMGEGSTRGPNLDELPSLMKGEQKKYLLDLEKAQPPKPKKDPFARSKKAKAKKKKQKKMGGGVLKYAYGGKVKGVRGAGCARQGVRKAKMVTMKGV